MHTVVSVHHCYNPLTLAFQDYKSIFQISIEMVYDTKHFYLPHLPSLMYLIVKHQNETYDHQFEHIVL